MGWHCFEAGEATLPAVVFLHGFMGSGSDWSEIMRGLKDEYHCVAFDLPGHGKTGLINHRSSLTVAIVAEQLATELMRRDLKQVALVGYSMGGRIALQFALDFRQNVSRLVLESANPGIRDEAERQKRAAADDTKAADLRRTGVAQFVEAWYDQPLFQSLKRRPEILNVVKRERDRNDAEALADILSALSVGRQDSLWSELRRLSMPVLLLSGSMDEKYNAISLRMRNEIPDCKWETIDGAGHNMHLEEPVRFTGILRNFLAPPMREQGNDAERKKYE